MKKFYQLVEESLSGFDNHIKVKGSYLDCLKGMKEIKKGYIERFDKGIEFDEKGNNLGVIVKTKGWLK